MKETRLRIGVSSTNERKNKKEKPQKNNVKHESGQKQK
jgi:hypothetical protein